MSDRRQDPGRSTQPSTPVDRLSEDVAGVVREELRAIRTQLRDSVRPAGSGLLMLAISAGCAVLGAGAASTTVLRILEAALPRRLAAAGLTAGYLTAALFLGALGLDRLRAAGGSSERLAHEIRQVLSTARSRVAPAGGAAAREALDR